jgi:hypothetical protein
MYDPGTMQPTDQTWKDVVAEALRDLGGQAHLSDINAHLASHPKTATNPTWRDTIRRVVRQYRVFEPVPPARSGVYRLVEIETAALQAQSIDGANGEVNHSIAQGMLVSLGSLYGYETFVPAPDQTMRRFQDHALGDLVSVRDCAAVFPSRNLSRIRQIDVLWFDEDDDGLFPVYAFEVEHTTRVRDGLDRLLKIPARFPARLFVVGPGDKEEQLFQRLLEQAPLSQYRYRFIFRRYEQLEKLYNLAAKHGSQRDAFGVLERGARL